MFDSIIIHPRVNQRHPEITEADIISAWKTALAIQNRTYRPPDYYVAAGVDTKGRLIEMVGVELENGTLMIYHAMKLSKKVRNELGL